MRLKLTTWDSSHNINDVTNYEAGLTPEVVMPSAMATFIDLGQGDPILAGKTLDGGYLTFYILLRGSLETQRDTINGWFRANDFTFRKLVAQDLDNANKEWYVEGYPVTPPILSAESASKYTVTLALKQPYWIESSQQTDTWSITAGTETQPITSVGNMPALPLFEITAIQAKSSNGIAYKTFYAIHTSGYGATKIPVDITGGGLDTAALTTAKMRADGFDVGVNINGVYVDRWFGEGLHAFDTIDTTIWANMSFKPAPTMTLSVALDGITTPATLKVAYTDAAITLPQNSTVQIGTELITYSSYTVDAATKIITFVPTLRAAKGSSIAAHSIAAAVYWIENEVWLTYGNASATAPVINDANKPILDLAISDNSTWKYLLFGDAAGLRSGAPVLQKTGINPNAYGFTGNEDTNVSPYTDAGIKLSSKVGNFSLIDDDSRTRIEWMFNHPGGISNFAAAGKAYQVGTRWPSYAITNRGFLIGNLPSSIYYVIPAPSIAAVWQAITSINVAISNNSKNVYFASTGGQGSTLPMPYSMVQLTEVTLTNYAPPTVTPMGVEQANYKLSGSLLNDTTDESIIFNDLITKTSNKITIDCENQEVYSADGKRLRGMIQFGGAKRDEWMTLVAGANSLVFTDTGTVEVTIVTKWRGRNTI